LLSCLVDTRLEMSQTNVCEVGWMSVG
jgi:hypothetical protein